MSLTCWHAARPVTAGVQIHSRLPRLRSALSHGLLPEQLATDAARRLAGVPDAILSGVESDVLSQLTGDVTAGDRPSRAALDSMVDAAIERHDPAPPRTPSPAPTSAESNTAAWAARVFSKVCCDNTSHSSELKNASAAVLSKHDPTRPIDWRIPRSWHGFVNA